MVESSYCLLAIRIAVPPAAHRQAGSTVATFLANAELIESLTGQKIKFSGLSSVSRLSNALKLTELTFEISQKTDLSYAQLVRIGHLAVSPARW